MNFDFTDEQQQLKETLERFVRKDYAFDKRREIVASKDGFSRAVWQQLAELGVLGLTLPEAHGGLGGNAVDTLIVMEAFGRGMVVEPYLSTIVIGAGLVATAGSAEQQAEILPRVAAGELLLALAHYEAGGRYETGAIATTAVKDGAGWRINGAKSVVLGGGAADRIVVSARTGGKDGGISLFLLDGKAAGLARHDYPTQDGHRAADLQLKDLRIGADALIGREGQGLAVVERAVDAGCAALCAEAVGNMTALLEATLAYTKTRKQFGVPIGSFQVLQHRMADMLMYAEQARSMTILAAAKVGSEDALERARAVAAAKTLVGQAARFVGQQAVQLHGGIGVTDELSVSHYFKRLTMINATFGDADHQLARFSDLMLGGQQRTPARKAA